MHISRLGGGVALLRFRNTKTISKQPTKMSKCVHGRRVRIYRRIWCMLEFTYTQVQCDAAHWKLAEMLRNR